MIYKIENEPLPIVTCQLQSGESMVSQPGAMSWMSPNIRMETSVKGGKEKSFSRILTGESIFQNRYAAMNGPGSITFASTFPGSIRAFEIRPNHEMIVQSTGFLASEIGVELSIHHHNNFKTAFFSGEGLFMQRLSGYGIVFTEFDGCIKEYVLKKGQKIIVNSGYLAAMDATCSMDIQPVQGKLNKFFGGHGFFNTVITGPGHIYLQTMPIAKLAGVISDYLPQTYSDNYDSSNSGN